ALLGHELDPDRPQPVLLDTPIHLRQHLLGLERAARVVARQPLEPESVPRLPRHSAPAPDRSATSGCPGITGRPGAASSSSTVPSSGASMWISIFIDSITTSTSPRATRAPHCTRTCHTLPCTWLSTIAAPSATADASSATTGSRSVSSEAASAHRRRSA